MILIIFYTFVSSIVFVYGIGLECLYVYLENPKKIYLFFIKNFIGVLISVSLIWGLCRYVLNPLRLHFDYNFVRGFEFDFWAYSP